MNDRTEHYIIDDRPFKNLDNHVDIEFDLSIGYFSLPIVSIWFQYFHISIIKLSITNNISYGCYLNFQITAYK